MSSRPTIFIFLSNIQFPKHSLSSSFGGFYYQGRYASVPDSSKRLFMFWWPWWIDKPLENKSKDQDNITLVYAGFGDECKVEDLDSLRTYKFRLTVEIDGSKISTSSDWISITTNKEPFRYVSFWNDIIWTIWNGVFSGNWNFGAKISDFEVIHRLLS